MVVGEKQRQFGEPLHHILSMTYDIQVTSRSHGRFLRAVSEERLVSDEELEIQVLHDKTFVPPRTLGAAGGLYAADTGICLRGSTLYRDIGRVHKAPVDVLRSAVSFNEPCLYLGVIHSCWGHTITDSLKFFWPFLHPDRYPFLRTCRIVYAPLVPAKGLLDNMRKIMAVMNIDPGRLTEIQVPTQFSTLFYPAESFWRESSRNRCYCSNEYINVIERICARMRLTKEGMHPRKIYFTRSGWPCGDYGEKVVEQAFHSAGYEVFRPEELSLERQIELLQHADSFAATEGSCAHNALFLRPGAELVVLRKYAMPNAYQLTINAAKGLRVVYVDSFLSFPVLWEDQYNRSRGPNFLFVNRMLARYLGIPKPPFPIRVFLRFLYAGLRARMRRTFTRRK